jgi:protein tyrosine/serine phosphatase
MSQSLPIPESYWVITERFLAGEYPGSSFSEETARKRIECFLESGFNAFIDLTRPNELMPYENILREQAAAYNINPFYQRMSIQDFGLPAPTGMKATLDLIDQLLNQNKKIYLHCWGGIGRTGTTVGCYLVRHGMSGDQALAQIAAWWRNVPKRVLHPRSPETDEQHAFVRSWKDPIPDPSPMQGKGANPIPDPSPA